MKLNRLLEITTILLNKKTVTAAELAERFGVSARTIYRDIDVLSASGVPVYSSQGANGGISILEDYTVNRAVLSGAERESILLALQTLNATRFPEIDAVLEKLGGIFKKTDSDWISVDFSPWGSNPNSGDKFTDIKAAIQQSKIIEVDYINAYNEKSRRKIEPLRLIFKSQAWYLWGYCLNKHDYRTFRISRVKKVRITGKTFDRNLIHETAKDEEGKSFEKDAKDPPFTKLTLEFTEDVLHRLCDDYDDDMIAPTSDGKYRIDLCFPENEWLYSYIMSYGPFVKVISPARVGRVIRERAARIAGYY
ncbi:MAG: YafY family transcriptional regulator [Oscillospiraceae bacterium]|nr:YafY family transcriptional regulator [Oscillospiraceae bacterium]